MGIDIELPEIQQQASISDGYPVPLDEEAQIPQEYPHHPHIHPPVILLQASPGLLQSSPPPTCDAFCLNPGVAIITYTSLTVAFILMVIIMFISPFVGLNEEWVPGAGLVSGLIFLAPMIWVFHLFLNIKDFWKSSTLTAIWAGHLLSCVIFGLAVLPLFFIFLIYLLTQIPFDRSVVPETLIRSVSEYHSTLYGTPNGLVIFGASLMIPETKTKSVAASASVAFGISSGLAQACMICLYFIFFGFMSVYFDYPIFIIIVLCAFDVLFGSALSIFQMMTLLFLRDSKQLFSEKAANFIHHPLFLLLISLIIRIGFFSLIFGIALPYGFSENENDGYAVPVSVMFGTPGMMFYSETALIVIGTLCGVGTLAVFGILIATTIENFAKSSRT